MSHENEDCDVTDISYDLEIANIRQRSSCGGTWVTGKIAGYRFEALVFAEHADNPQWELRDSRISKLWLSLIANKETSFNWDRGMDIPAASKKAQAVVDFLACGLADLIYAN